MNTKLSMTTLVLLGIFTTTINAEQTRTYNQPPVITDEFVVEENEQKALSHLEKDTDKIQIETDILGLKKFKNETFNFDQIKQRFDEGLKKLREDEPSTRSTHHY